MIADLKYFDGSLARIDRVPAELRKLYATAFEVDPAWLVEAGARRQKWIDQSQSLNLYYGGRLGQEARRDLQARVDARAEDDLLPALAGRDARREIDGQGRAAERGAERRRRASEAGAGEEPKFCAIDNPECEACQ